MAEVDVGVGGFRVEFDRLAEGVAGLGQLVLVKEGNAEVAVGEGIFRVEVDRLAVGVDGLVQLFLFR
jgi:hypothetical protein